MSASIPIACMFRAVWPENTAKHAARASGMSHRTAQGWLSERFTPSAATLLLMAQRNEKLRAEMIRRLEGYPNEGMGAGVLSVARRATDAPSRTADGPGASVAKEG